MEHASPERVKAMFCVHMGGSDCVGGNLLICPLRLMIYPGTLTCEVSQPYRKKVILGYCLKNQTVQTGTVALHQTPLWRLILVHGRTIPDRFPMPSRLLGNMGSKLQEQYMIITDQPVMLTILLVHRSKGQALGVHNLLRNTSDSLATHWQLRMQLLTDSNVFCSKSSERGDAPLSIPRRPTTACDKINKS